MASARDIYDFDETANLGDGAFGTVVRGHCRRTSSPIAVKIVSMPHLWDCGIPATSLREIAALKQLKHQNVVELLGVACETDRLLLFFEFGERDLKKHMNMLGGDLMPLSVQDFTKQLLIGLDYGIEVDVWSAACILVEMATGLPFVVSDCEIAMVFGIFAKLGTPTQEIWPELDELAHFKDTFPQWRPRGWHNIRNTLEKIGRAGIDLLEKMTVYRPCARVSARRALLHSYFKQAPPPMAKAAGHFDAEVEMPGSVDESVDEHS
eukprot:TRINITY_DN33401_c1_g1_i2.p1 TRINITY_DN33401_c1_g1~~TRINITY_DN33401_c1_g1_i2.p1  ORF type:complete len:285 (-),score=40.14 TRINITY_DN33401_c1_g1_i2:67-861(-)